MDYFCPVCERVKTDQPFHSAMLKKRVCSHCMSKRNATNQAPVAKQVDATDLKSVGRKVVPVQFRPGAPR